MFSGEDSKGNACAATLKFGDNGLFLSVGWFWAGNRKQDLRREVPLERVSARDVSETVEKYTHDQGTVAIQILKRGHGFKARLNAILRKEGGRLTAVELSDFSNKKALACGNLGKPTPLIVVREN